MLIKIKIAVATILPPQTPPKVFQLPYAIFCKQIQTAGIIPKKVTHNTNPQVKKFEAELELGRWKAGRRRREFWAEEIS